MTRALRKAATTGAAHLLAALLTLCGTSPAQARGLTRSGVAPGRAAADISPQERLQLGAYGTLLLGFESNYNYAPDAVGIDPQPSAMTQIEAGGDVRFRPSTAVYLRSELSGMIRLPFSGARHSDYLVELPALLLYRMTPKLELSLFNHVSVERARSTPVGLDEEIKSSAVASSDPLTYLAGHEQLRPALAYHFLPNAYVEAGPYLRFKSVSYDVKVTDPDYRFFDLGFDLSGKYIHDRRFSARLRYDFAYRLFGNYDTRPPEYCLLDSNDDCTANPRQGQNLEMQRHIAGLYLGAHVWGPLSLDASYAFRLVRDNGGYFSYNEHMIGGGASLVWPDRVTARAGLLYQKRSYTNRTPCEAGPCTPASSQVLDRAESAVTAHARVTVTVTEWLQLLGIYELEDASSETSDFLVPLHRVLAGASLVI